MMGTLYVIGTPAVKPDDITLRALRILEEAALVVGDDVGDQELLARHGITTPLLVVSRLDPVALLDRILDALATSNVALLSPGWSPAPPTTGQRLVQAVLAHGLAVVPVPGPSFPVTALIISGLPADSYVYLDRLPSDPTARRSLLASVAAERRTLVALESPHRLQATLADLAGALGSRPLVLVAALEQGDGEIWRGVLGEVPEDLPDRGAPLPWALIIGAAQDQAPNWDRDRLWSEIQASLAQGQGVKEASRQLAAVSGWPRREVYRLAVAASKAPSGATAPPGPEETAL